MSEQLAAVLRTVDGEAVPLTGVAARGRLEGLLFELEVEQRYRNGGRETIEAEYTFPLPQRAVLLGLELVIGGRELEARAVRRATARRNYEQAIDDGDTAVLLEQAGDGLWTASLGNLQAGEEAVIRYRYAELLDRLGDSVRLAIPTVIAPRYGGAAEQGLAPHQAPEVDLAVEYPFALEVDVLGPVADAAICSPSHRIAVAVIDGEHGGRRVTLAAGGTLDRDFVLSLAGVATQSAGLVAPDDAAGEGAHAVLLSLDPQLPLPESAPMALKLLVDCSGSMAGSSIGCARRALLAIAARLQPADRVSFTRFGTHVEQVALADAGPGGRWTLFGMGERRHAPDGRGSLAPATPAVLERLRHALAGLDADLGGTQLAGAIRAAVGVPADEVAVRNVLLVTDGEVWHLSDVLAEAEVSGHRLFVVAVGSAPNEALAREVAARTGGACEFVGPNEDAEAVIVRMYQRMREPPKRVVRVDWPLAPAWQGPLPAAVFSGDTLHVAAGFATAPAGEVRVVVGGLPAGEVTLTATLVPAAGHAVLPRVAAARRLALLPEEEAAALAERYQLASPYTSFVVVQVRDADKKAAGLPKAAKVPQMLAAGWGGTSAVSRVASAPPSMAGAYERMSYDYELMDIPPMLRRADIPDTLAMRTRVEAARSAYGPAGGEADLAGLAPAEWLARLAELLSSGQPLPTLVAELSATGLPPSIAGWLQWLVLLDAPEAEERVVRLWIALLARSAAGDGLAPAERDALVGDALGHREDRALRRQLLERLDGVSADAWPARVPVTAAS